MCFSVFCAENIFAQNKFTQNGIDSAAIQNRVNMEYARRDSMFNALRTKRTQDSIARELQKQKLQEFRDSMAQARIKKRMDDSIARVKAKLKLIEDKRLKDSTDLALRQKTADSLATIKAIEDKKRQELQRINDSIALVKQRTSDSLRDARNAYNDSLKTVRMKAAADRKALEKYKNSKQYADSVALAKKQKKEDLAANRALKNEAIKAERDRISDSIKTVRQQYNDSLSTVRERIKDSTNTARAAEIDKIKAERQRVNDSLKIAREARMDSLNAKRKIVKTAQEEEIKKKKKDIGLKIDMSEQLHDKKKEEWTNDKLLKRKWSIHRRIYQNTVTRYNYYYNANRKYKEAVRNLKKNHKDDYAKNISLFPFNVEKAGSSAASEMDTVIKKASFSTQIHDPRSKWFDNLFFLMGKASFVKNDFEGAITTFQFIANEYKDKVKKDKKTESTTDAPLSLATVDNRKGIRKLRHHPIRNEALVWLAKSYIHAEQYSEAQSLLGILEKDKLFPERNKTDLFLTKAFLDLQQQNNQEAIADLESALKHKMAQSQRSRAEFLVAQLYANEKDYAKSTSHYKLALSKKNQPEMDFFIKLNIAQNAALGGGDKSYAINQLEKIINDPKFAKFKSQALNALAGIESDENPEQAIKYLLKAIKNPENKDLRQKAISFESLGKIYYKQSKYSLAKMAYDSAFTYGSNPPIENLTEISTRKNVLTEIVKYTDLIQSSDSMLALSTKSEKEQKAAAKRELEKLKNQEKAQVETVTQVVALQPVAKSKSNWYFYNNNLTQKGSADFKQKWGTRKLEDNWRRASTSQSNFSSNNNSSEEESTDEKSSVNGVTIASLLAKVPKTQAEKDALEHKVIDAYYNLGLIYFSQLQDYNKSIEAFTTLNQKYPANLFKKQAYYGLYVDYNKINNKPESDRYKKLLDDEFKNSEFALLANNPTYKEDKSKELKVLFDHYDSTYQQYKNGKYQEALASVSYAQTSFTNNPIRAKYELVEAISNAGLKEMIKCKKGLEKIISTYPNSEEQVRAQEILNYINAENKPIDSLSSNSKNMAGDANGMTDSMKTAEAYKALAHSEGKGVYIYEPNSVHYVIIFIKKLDGKMMALKSGISDYNLLKYNVEGYTTGMNLLTEGQGIINIQKFNNNVFAKKYLGNMVNEKLLFTQYDKKEYEMAIISAKNFTELLSTRDILGYMKFYRQHYP